MILEKLPLALNQNVWAEPPVLPVPVSLSSADAFIDVGGHALRACVFISP
jgi:hypothetical protein